MNTYYFKGVNKKGRNMRGHIEAESLALAKQTIKQSGIYVTSISDQIQKKSMTSFLLSSKRVDVKTLANMTRSLSTMLKAGIPLVESLDTIALQLDHLTMKNIVNQIRNSVNEGNSFFKSLQSHPQVFNKAFIAMCEAGEISGTLDLVLLRLAELTQSTSRLQSKVRAALVYPALMTIFSCFIIVFLLTYVVPKVRVLFENTENITLPWYSTLMIDASDFLQKYWISSSLILILSVFTIWRFTKSKSGQKIWDRLMLKIPIFGNVIRSTIISRLTRTLSTLLHGGVPIIESLDIVQNVVNNSVIHKVILEAKEAIQRGDNLSNPFIQSGVFPPMVTQMIHVGEKTGQLEQMLKQISDTYDNQIQNDVEALTSLLEPVMLIVMGGFIAFIVFSTIIPLMQMYNTTTI